MSSHTNPSASGTSGLKNRPKGSDFLQQRLKAWQPILTPRWVIISFVVVGAVFLPIGFLLKAASDSVVEVAVQYDGAGTAAHLKDCRIAASTPLSNTETAAACNITLDISADMEPPIYVYYQLDNFYQNHRRYVKSRDDSQLASGDPPENPSKNDFKDCEPLITSDSGRLLWPCGLIANSFFNDTFTFADESLGFSDQDIAWKTDREKKFKNVPLEKQLALNETYTFLHEQYPTVIDPSKGVEDEHFIVWMRVAALPKFRKLYGRVNKKLTKGDKVTVQVHSNFPVASFDGKKSIVLSTTSALGGKNPFLGIAYIVVACVCLALAGVFGIKQLINPRKPGDTLHLQWSQSAS